MSRNYWKFTTITLALLLFMIACGGSIPTMTTTVTNAAASVHAFMVPGHARMTTTTTTARSTSGFSLIPQAEAQAPAPTVKLTGNYYGTCGDVPANRPELVTGLGGIANGSLLNTDCSFPTSPDDIAAFNNNGSPVIGTGTLANLVIVADNVTPLSADVYVNGTKVWTTDCSTSATSTRCTDLTHSAALNDAGTVVVVLTSTADVTNARVYLGIQ